MSGLIGNQSKHRRGRQSRQDRNGGDTGSKNTTLTKNSIELESTSRTNMSKMETKGKKKGMKSGDEGILSRDTKRFKESFATHYDRHFTVKSM